MDIVKECATGLHNALMQMSNENLAVCTDRKTAIFNISTAALITFVALGILGVVSLLPTILLGGLSLFGRVVADESYGAIIEGGSIVGQAIRAITPRNAIRPDPSLQFAKTVLFYKFM